LVIAFLYLIAAQASQPVLPAREADAGLRCTAAFMALADAQKPAFVPAIGDPALVDRAMAFTLLTRQKLARGPEPRQSAVDRAMAALAEVQGAAKRSGGGDAYFRAEIRRCRPLIENALSEEAERLSIAPAELPLDYLRCVVVYAMGYGVAFRPETEQGRYGNEAARKFEQLYTKSRSLAAAGAEEWQQIWARDMQTIEAARESGTTRRDESLHCVLLAIRSEAKP
jgi:hypothetical protein